MSTKYEKDIFYIQVTPVKEKYKSASGEEKEAKVDLITLPPGTLLFRGVRIPNPSLGQDFRYFYRDFLGDPEPDGKMCVSPTHNVFFYPFPFVPFGIHDMGITFDSIQLVVLVHPITVISTINPSTMVRGSVKQFDGTAPFQRCDKFSFDCHPQSPKELEAKAYDNCLNPEYQVKSGVRGWMAIADLDSLKPRFYEKRGKPITSAPMPAYVKNLDNRLSGKAPELLAWAYSDHINHAGFPEIALYPYKNHPGKQNIVRGVKTSARAVSFIEKEALSDNLNYLPLAVFTDKVTVSMVYGKFLFETVPSPSSDSVKNKQIQIEKRLEDYLEHMKVKGANLPFYGYGKLSFDTRTGFFVLPQVLPKNLTVPLPSRKTIPYSDLLLPMDSEEANRRVLTYMLLFRKFFPNTFMNDFGLEKGFGVKRAMVFERPPVLSKLFTELSIPIPESYKGVLGRAAKQFEMNKKEQEKKTSSLTLYKSFFFPRPRYEKGEFKEITVSRPRTPEFFEPRTPEFGEPSPRTPEFFEPRTPEFGEPSPSLKGGSQKKTRKAKKHIRRGTLKASMKHPLTYIKDFSRIWKKLGSKK
jgi:hypothetical protein